MPKRTADLTPKEQRFVEEYLVDLNGSAAAIRAGYSARSSRSTASDLLAKPNVQAAVTAGRAKLMKRAEITAERILEELQRIAFADVRAISSWDADGVRPRDSSLLTDAEAAAIAEIGSSETAFGTTIKVKLHDKGKALDLLGQYLALWKSRVELTGKNGGPIEHANAQRLGDDELEAIARAGRGGASAPSPRPR